MTPLPHSPEAEEHVLSCCLLPNSDTLARCQSAGLTPDDFHTPANRLAYSTLLSLHSRQLPVSVEAVTLELSGHASPNDLLAILALDNPAKVPTATHASYYIAKVAELSAKRRIITQATALIEHASNGTTLDELSQQAKALIPQRPSLQNWQEREVKVVAPPSEPDTRLFLAGKPIATPGNLVTIISKAKTGKTTTIGAMVAAIVAAHYDRHDADTFGFTAPHTDEAVILIDTEQSPFDAYTCHQRAFARASQSTDVPWFKHYALVGYTAAQLKSSLEPILEQAASKHKAVFSLILDGVADFVASVNDEAECNEFVAYLRSLAVKFNCPIICVIHSNEAKMSGDDGRGHLGKQLIRKAESNLLLKKDSSGITQITSDKQRKAPITVEDNVAFQWSEELQRHVSCQPGQRTTKGGRPKGTTFQSLESVWPRSADKAMTQAQILKFAKDEEGVSESTLRRIINDAVRDGLLVKVPSSLGNKYHLPF